MLQWHVKEGDKVKQFDKLLEVQSDKATVDITSRYEGVVKKLHYKVGDMAKTGSALLDIEVAGSGAAEAPKKAAAPASEPTKSSAPTAAATSTSSSSTPSHIKGLATPAVRRIAMEHKVSVHDVLGTGKDGRVTKEDILKFVENGGDKQAQATSTATTTTATAAPSGPSRIPADIRQPIRGLQRAMVKSMVASWAVPHFGYADEIHMDGLMRLRNHLKPIAEAKKVKLTFLPIILKATSMALKQYPSLNASVSQDGDEVVIRGSHNIGVAMDTPRGLIVPNIKGIQEKSIFDIAAELVRLQGLASAGKLGEADLSDGTFRYVNHVSINE